MKLILVSGSKLFVNSIKPKPNIPYFPHHSLFLRSGWLIHENLFIVSRRSFYSGVEKRRNKRLFESADGWRRVVSANCAFRNNSEYDYIRTTRVARRRLHDAHIKNRGFSGRRPRVCHVSIGPITGRSWGQRHVNSGV